jgi:hypothetical protein
MTERSSAKRASDAKTQQASARNRELARKAIELAPQYGEQIVDRWLTVARAILDHEGASWSQIGEACGMGKYEAASCFRRLLVVTGLRS